MQPLKAIVRNGRLVLDEPTDLPEGEVVTLVSEQQLSDAVDGLDDEERAALHESLHEGIEQLERGEGIELADALAHLRALR